MTTATETRYYVAAGNYAAAPDRENFALTEREAGTVGIDAEGRAHAIIDCGRCGGDGIYTEFHGVCYRCGGTGTEQARVYTAEEWDAKREASIERAERKARKAREEREATQAANVEEHGPEFARALFAVLDSDDPVEEFGGFLEDVASKTTERVLTVRQAEAFTEAYQRRIDREAERENAAPVPTGSGIEVEGIVLKTEVRESVYGRKVVWTVKGDEGWLVWGTIPAALRREVHHTDLKGARVRFTANVEPSDDEHFGFTKRPRKAEVIAPAA